jgi:putative transposase
MPSTQIISLNETFIKLFAENSFAEFLLLSVQSVLNFIMTYEANEILKSERNQSSEGQQRYRNGYRTRQLNSRLGKLQLKVPRFRTGSSYFPSFLSRYKKTEQALVAVIQEAYINGVSTRKMSSVLEKMGIEEMSKSMVSRLCSSLSEESEAFRLRPILKPVPYLYLDATYFKTTQDGLNCLLMAYGVSDSGRREILGFELVSSESESSWDGFIGHLKEKGLSGVELVISDAHAGLKKAVFKELLGAKWQRCLVHFGRNILDVTPKKLKDEVVRQLGDFRTAENKELARNKYHQLISFMSDHKKVVQRLESAEEDILHYFDFPEHHWSKIRSTNPLERINREIKRRTNSVCVFFSGDSILRLVGQLLIDEQEKWDKVQRSYMKGVSELKDRRKVTQLLMLEQKAEKAA